MRNLLTTCHKIQPVISKNIATFKIPYKLSAVFIQAGVFIFNYILIWIGIYFNQLAAVKKINSAISAEK